jgi:hypothetical protein
MDMVGVGDWRCLVDLMVGGRCLGNGLVVGSLVVCDRLTLGLDSPSFSPAAMHNFRARPICSADTAVT